MQQLGYVPPAAVRPAFPVATAAASRAPPGRSATLGCHGPCRPTAAALGPGRLRCYVRHNTAASEPVLIHLSVAPRRNGEYHCAQHLIASQGGACQGATARTTDSNLVARRPSVGLRFSEWPALGGGELLGCAASRGCCIRAACTHVMHSQSAGKSRSEAHHWQHLSWPSSVVSCIARGIEHGC
jgi:hypothetical protein